jgi:hypothetical protein
VDNMKTQNETNNLLPSGPEIFRFNGVPIMVQPVFWPLPVLVIGMLTWIAGLRRPQRSWVQRLSVGLLAMPVALLADIGHAMAHTISARLAGAPMDEILLSAQMPRTLYQNNAVPPQVHILRSLGGPVFSLISAALSLFWRSQAARGSVSRELAEISLFGHSFILFASLVPLPMVDGGTILKWQLVKAGQTPEHADQVVQKTSLGLGAAFLALGVGLGLIRKRRLVGSLLAAGGAAAIAAGVGWLK